MQDEAFVCDKQARLEGNISLFEGVCLEQERIPTCPCRYNKLCRSLYAAGGLLFHEHSSMSMSMVDPLVTRAQGSMGRDAHQNQFSNHKQRNSYTYKILVFQNWLHEQFEA